MTKSRKLPDKKRVISLCNNMGISYTYDKLDNILVSKYSFDYYYKYEDRIEKLQKMFEKEEGLVTVQEIDEIEYYVTDFIFYFMNRVATKKEDFIGHDELCLDMSKLLDQKIHITYRKYKEYLLEIEREIRKIEDSSEKSKESFTKLQIKYNRLYEELKNYYKKEKSFIGNFCFDIFKFSVNAFLFIGIFNLYSHYRNI